MHNRRWLAIALAAGAALLVPFALTAGGETEPDRALAADGDLAADGTVSPSVSPTDDPPGTRSGSTAPPVTTSAAPIATAPSTTTTLPPPPTTTLPPEVGSDACRLKGEHQPAGTTSRVPGETLPGPGVVWDVRVEIEDGLSIDPGCFAAAVLEILSDQRGWGRNGDLSFRLADGDTYDFKLILGSPDLVDALCAPINTGGEYSCRNGDVVAINVDRWEFGTDSFGDDLTTYRQYLINHEIGHRLGHVHIPCPAAGEPAPVMMQQSKFTEPCLPNGWPLDSEL